MFSLPLGMPLKELKKRVVDYGYSRIPVFRDKPDNIIGILYAKDLLTGLSQEKEISPDRNPSAQALFCAAAEEGVIAFLRISRKRKCIWH